jgi:hypothetical protein
MNDHLKILARKGTVTIREDAKGKAIVAVKTAAGNITLRGGTKDQLLAELCQMCRDLPDTT